MADNEAAEAVQTLFASFFEARRAIAEHIVAAQQRDRNLAEGFFTEGMEVLKANQKAGQDLVAAQELSVQHTQRFFAEGLEVLKANQTAAQSLVAAQEQNMHYAQRFFNQAAEMLESQDESMRALMQNLDHLMEKQLEAFQTLARAPMDLTFEFLSNPLASYQRALDMSESITREGQKRAWEMTEQMMQATQNMGEHNLE